MLKRIGLFILMLSLLLVLAPGVVAIDFSQLGGFYGEEFYLTLAIDDPEAVIYYTLDGSQPNPNHIQGKTYYIKQSYPHGELEERTFWTYRYSQPIPITDRSGEPSRIGDINTTFSEGFYIPPGDIPKATVVRAMALYSDGSSGPIITQTFFIGEGFREGLDLPIISLALDEESLFDYYQGIYVPGQIFDGWRADNPELSLVYQIHGANYEMRGHDWEREGHIAFFEADGSLAFAQNLGVRTHGGWTRSYQRKSLRLYPRNDYDDLNRIEHQIFPGLTKKGDPWQSLDSFNRLILRNSGNDDNSTLFRDGVLQGLVSHLSFSTQSYRPALLFINGEYWGIFNIRERYDDFYFHSHYGIDRNQVVILSNHATIEEGTIEDRQDFFNLRGYINREDMDDPLHYQYVEELMDIDNFIEYHLANIYFGNTDWPGNNITYWRKRSDQYIPDAPYGHDGRWRWALNDTDFGFGLRGGLEDINHNTLAFAVERLGPVWPNPEWSTVILRNLLESSVFRTKFINAFADNINTTFNPHRVIGEIDRAAHTLAPLMEEHIHRWGRPSSVGEWQENIEVMKEFALRRPQAVWRHLEEHFDLRGTVQVTLNNNMPERGLVKINTIAISTETPGIIDPGSWTGVYFKDVPIEITAIPAPGHRFVTWVGDVASTDPYLTLALTDDLELTPIFIRDLSDVEVDIPDTGLRESINRILRKDAQAVIYASELANLQRLNLRGQGIEKIEGLQYAVNLVELDLRENRIKDITPLANLINLETLTIRDNRVEDISPLANLVKLRDLSIHSNRVQDISVLANLIELEELTLRGNRIEDIAPLASLQKLWDVNLRDNNITDISPLQGLKNIQGEDSRLHLSGNKITDFSPIAQYYQGIADVDFLFDN